MAVHIMDGSPLDNLMEIRADECEPPALIIELSHAEAQALANAAEEWRAHIGGRRRSLPLVHSSWKALQRALGKEV